MFVTEETIRRPNMDRVDADCVAMIPTERPLDASFLQSTGLNEVIAGNYIKFFAYHRRVRQAALTGFHMAVNGDRHSIVNPW